MIFQLYNFYHQDFPHGAEISLINHLMVGPQLPGEVVVGGRVADLALDHGRVGVHVVPDVVHHLPPGNKVLGQALVLST